MQTQSIKESIKNNQSIQQISMESEQLNDQTSNKQLNERRTNSEFFSDQGYLKTALIWVTVVIVCLIAVSFSGILWHMKLLKLNQGQQTVIRTLMHSVRNRVQKGFPIQTSDLNSRFKTVSKHSQPAVEYINIGQVENRLEYFNQLPICVIIGVQGNVDFRHTITQSLESVIYSNFKTVYLSSTLGKSANYYKIKQLLETECLDEGYGLYVFTNEPVTETSLLYINHEHQTNNAWLLTQNVPHKGTQIISVYGQIFNLIGKNDFKQTNSPYLENKLDYSCWVTVALLELNLYHQKNIKAQYVYKKMSFLLCPFCFTFEYCSWKKGQALTYQPLHSFDQDHKINLQLLNEQLFQMLSKGFENGNENEEQVNNLYLYSLVDRLKSWENQQIGHLPKNHSLVTRQWMDFEKSETIVSQNPKEQQKQLHICATVIQNSTSKNKQFIKTLHSILEQNYSNYHIVLIDDFPEGDNLREAIKYMQWRQFYKIIYIQNLKQKYQAFNIFNAAYNFCNQTDIQVIIHNNEELIGTHAFKYINREYQRGDKWLVYTGSKDGSYKHGYTQKFPPFDSVHDSTTVSRKLPQSMNPLRTWIVNLIKRVPFRLVKNQFSQWIMAGYDEAIQFTLLEMAPENKIGYIPKILYTSKTDEVINHYRIQQLARIKQQTLKFIKSLKPLEKIQSLEIDPFVNQRIQKNFNELKKLQKIGYQVIKPEQISQQ